MQAGPRNRRPVKRRLLACLAAGMLLAAVFTAPACRGPQEEPPPEASEMQGALPTEDAADAAASAGGDGSQTEDEVEEIGGVDPEPRAGDEVAQAAPPEDGPDGEPSYASTLEIASCRIPYIEAYRCDRPPDGCAVLWEGSDSTSDGSWGYFAGHNPGVFDVVMELAPGDACRVCDAGGCTREYSVTEAFDIPSDTTWEQLSPLVCDEAESIVLQTCAGDGAHYRIVVARSADADAPA